jgi:hypothetical protein
MSLRVFWWSRGVCIGMLVMAMWADCVRLPGGEDEKNGMKKADH